MQVYNTMVAKRQERNIITYSSLIAAADRAGRWEEGLTTWAHMAGDRCHPNLPAYNSAISCCAQGGVLPTCARVQNQPGCAVLYCAVPCPRWGPPNMRQGAKSTRLCCAVLCCAQGGVLTTCARVPNQPGCAVLCCAVLCPR